MKSDRKRLYFESDWKRPMKRRTRKRKCTLKNILRHHAETAFYGKTRSANPVMQRTTVHALAVRRCALRLELDTEPNTSLDGVIVPQNRRFVTVCFEESFSVAPDSVVEAARSLLSRDFTDTVSKTVRDVVVFRIGCNMIPLLPTQVGVGVVHFTASTVCTLTALRSSTSECSVEMST